MGQGQDARAVVRRRWPLTGGRVSVLVVMAAGWVALVVVAPVIGWGHW